MSTQLPNDFPKDVKILLVDDIPSARKIVSRMLGMLGITQLVEASSIKEAVEKLKTDRDVGLVIADIHLKDGKGTEILETVNSLEKDLPMIFVTSDMEKATFLDAVDKGASTYLLKPFSPVQLVSKMKEAFHLP